MFVGEEQEEEEDEEEEERECTFLFLENSIFIAAPFPSDTT